jgi:hydrogenase maturation protease
MLLTVRACKKVLAVEKSNVRPDIVVAGFGSPHGDDQVGWKVLAELARRPHAPARIVAIHEGTQLIGELDDCRKLILIDACCSGGPVGTISRFRWPDARIRRRHNHSTHGIGLCNALELAERLGRIPRHVEVFGVEIRESQGLGTMSSEVFRAASELEGIIRGELRETLHA